jgi:hypothetical protein
MACDGRKPAVGLLCRVLFRMVPGDLEIHVGEGAALVLTPAQTCGP